MSYLSQKYNFQIGPMIESDCIYIVLSPSSSKGNISLEPDDQFWCGFQQNRALYKQNVIKMKILEWFLVTNDSFPLYCGTVWLGVNINTQAIVKSEISIQELHFSKSFG